MASQTPDSQALLANRNPSVPLTAYDGKAGVVMGNFIYTTPNEDYIPCPVFGFRQVAVREDYRYGPDDYTLWPQPYSDTFPHLGAIPRRPTESNNPLSVMWYNPVDEDFIPINRSVALGLGKLRPAFLDQQLHPLLQAVQSRFTNYVALLPADSSHKIYISVIAQALQYTFIRLKSLPATWHDIQFTLTELQRYYLELVGMLDYMEVYKPRMDGTQNVSATTASAIGVFTSKPRIVEEFMAAGLPVWYMRQLTPSFGNNVLSVVEPLQYFGNLTTKVHSAFPVLHSSSSYISTGEVLGLIHRFSRKWISTPDPFEETSATTSSSTQHSPPSVLPSSSQGRPSRARSPSSSHHAGPPRKKAKHTTSKSGSSSSVSKNPPQQIQRDKFAPLQSPMAPYSIPAWAEALRHVDQTQAPAISQPPRGGYYAFPDPGLFISPETEKRRQHLIEQYCRIEDAWLARSFTTPGVSMTNQQWRNLLTIDFCKPLPSLTARSDETKATSNHREALKLLLPPRTRPAELATSGDAARFWSTNAWFDSGSLPPVDNIRLLLYRMYELNFRREVVVLDRYAHRGHSTPQKELAHELEIRELFPNQSYGYPPIDPPNAGLGADDIQSRLPFIMKFAMIMTKWKGDKPGIFSLGYREDISTIRVDEALQLEIEVARFYCQQFFNYFRRAAQIPHRLVEPAANSQ